MIKVCTIPCLKIKNQYSIPDIEYSEISGLKDLRANKEDISNLSEQSIIPVPGLMIDYDENSDGSYIPPHSDWIGPSGEAWIK